MWGLWQREKTDVEELSLRNIRGNGMGSYGAEQLSNMRVLEAEIREVCRILQPVKLQ